MSSLPSTVTLGPTMGKIGEFGLLLSAPPLQPSLNQGSRPMQYPTFDALPYIDFELPLTLGGSIAPQLDRYNWHYPENEPYHHPDAAGIPPKTIWENIYGKMTSSWNQTARKICYATRFLRGYVSETNFELLYSMIGNMQEVRATKSWFIGRGKQPDLYSISHNSLKFWSSLNFWKKSWFEGKIFGHSDQANIVKVAEIAPRILFEKAESVFSEYDQARNTLTRKAAVILRDEKYENKKYLQKLIQEFELISVEYRNRMVDLDLSSLGEASSCMRKLQIAIDKQLNTHFKSPDYIGMRQFYAVDDLKSYLTRFFKKMDIISERVTETYDHTLLEPPKYEGENEIERLRGRLYHLAKEQYELSEDNRRHLRGYSELINRFEAERSKEV